ncbi:DUF481 domain-containing protein [Terriglobus albidus]|uniref:DUF481 domain-containing protein n=1 Tax=Terriglobus albidus TaxID=1592106 RepID=UPI0021DF8567|nr:DUF481 domain-containing protein [Terriglobus albidus]
MSLFKHARGLALFFALIPAAMPAEDKPNTEKSNPDVIVFKNGDQLTGTLVRGVGNSILFKSDIVGEVTIPLSKIKELHSSGSFAVLKKDTPATRTNTQTGMVTVNDSTVTLLHPMGQVETLPVSNVAYIIDQAVYDRELEKKAGPLYGWTGSISAGASFVQSTQHGGTFTTGVKLIRTIPSVPYLPTRNRTLFNISESYGKLTTPVIPQTIPASPDSVVKTSIFHTDLERDQYVSKKFYYLGTTAFDHNFSSGLDLQQIYGAGLGWTPVLDGKQQLDVKGDIHYEKQEFENSASNLNLIGATIGEAYKRTLPRSMIFTQTMQFLPAFNETNAYSANFTTSVAMPVFKKLSMSIAASDGFLNNPSPGFRKNTFQFVTGVTYTLP